MCRSRLLHGLCCWAVLTLAHPFRVAADGGVLRLQQSAGPFWVTVFTAPEPLRAGAADISVMLQAQPGGPPLLDATVALELRPSDAGATVRATATRAAANNKLFYVAIVQLPAAGSWQLLVSVDRGTDHAEVHSELAVAPALPRLAAIWPYLAIPPLAIILFVLHQRLRYRQRFPIAS